MGRISYRSSFLVGVALVAAAVGNLCVETVSNSGIVGAGYHDNDHASVLPVIVGGFVLLVEIAIVRAIALLRGLPAGERDWLARTAAEISRRGSVHDLLSIIIFQFCALYTMEASEALISTGHLPLGGAWLGGPPLFSIAVHIGFGVLCSVLLARVMRAIVVTLATLVRAVLSIIAIAPRDSHLSRFGRERVSRAVSQIVNGGPFGGRAPPPDTSLVPV